MMWMVIRTPHTVWPLPGLSWFVSHLCTNHTVRLWLGPLICFIHISGPLHKKRYLAYFIWCGWSLECPPTLYGHGQGSAMCHICVLTTLLGCDWNLLSTSYTCLVNFIYIKGVWYTLNSVDGHKDATPYLYGHGQGYHHTHHHHYQHCQEWVL